MKDKESQTSLFLTCLHWEKHPVKLCHHSGDSYTDRNHLKYLYKIVCCVESVETKPPFPSVSCQSPKIALRARTFPLWYFAFPCCTELGEGKGNGFTPIMLHPDLSCPQFIAISLLPLTPFHLFKLGRKTGKEERRRGDWDKLSTGKAAACIVCCRLFQGFPGHLQITPTAYSYRRSHLSLQAQTSTMEPVIHFALS